MKKFLISLIIGITMMAIGTTAIFFELREFDVVEAADTVFQKENYHSEIFSLKHHDENVKITFLEGIGYSYEWIYDDTLKDQVKITMSNHVDYRIDHHQLTIQNINYYDDDFQNGWNRFDDFMEGLKKHKIYQFSDAHIYITTSHANQDRVIIEDEDDY